MKWEHRQELTRRRSGVGTDPDLFVQITALADSPQLAALIRGWIAASNNPALQQEPEQAMLPWLEQALATGQRIGAVRSDLPSALLIAVVLGMGQAMDTWLMTQQPDKDDLPRLIGALIEMIRGAVKPQPGYGQSAFDS